MLRQWEVFKVGPGDPETRLHVTMDCKGQILLGASALRRMGKPEAAILMFDKVNKLIGVLPTGSHTKYAFPVKSLKKVAARVIRANRFCRHHDIRVDRVTAFADAEIDAEGMLVLDLNKAVGIGKVSRPSKLATDHTDKH